MSARRLLRGTQPPSSNLKHASSSSSLSSGRAERPMRSESRKEAGSNKSQSPQSPLTDEQEAAERAERERRLTRQQKREAGIPEVAGDAKDEEDLDEEDGEGEVTRCVCGQVDYPGPPVPLTEGGRHSSRDRPASLAAAEGLPEDAGGLFIQCDECHVWQHGGCVGIMEESATPENYYCEQCRKEMHKLMIGARGQRYSRYLPVVEAALAHSPRRSSGPKDAEPRPAKNPDGKERPGLLISHKRRSTMNSRTVYDEEEMLKRAIEESKGDGTTKNGSNGHRKSKRARDDDSDEMKNDAAKRRKTGSEPEAPLQPPAGQSAEASDDESGEGQSRSSGDSKKSRSAAAQAQRERERVERDKEKDAERAQAAGRRSGRAERRHVDESEGTEESQMAPPAPRTAATTKTSRPQFSSKPAHNGTPSASTSHKKKATSKRRVGRNQYTKDRELTADKKDSPRASHSRGSDDAGNGADEGSASKAGPGIKGSRVKHLNAGRTTMNDLRKRAAGILEYISRTQVELAGTKSPGQDRSGSSTPPLRGRAGQINGPSKLSAEHSDERSARTETIERVDEASFKGLSSLEMMDVLTRELVHWQKDYGKYGEKS